MAFDTAFGREEVATRSACGGELSGAESVRGNWFFGQASQVGCEGIKVVAPATVRGA